MKKLPSPLLLLAGCVLFLAGCSGFDRGVASVGLRAELNGIERAADGTVTVTWSLLNPNVTPYLLDQVSHKIYLQGTLVGSTVDTQPMGVPAQQTVSKSSRLTPAGPAAERLIAEAATQGRVAYSLETQLMIRLYDEMTDKGVLTHTGTVPVTGK